MHVIEKNVFTYFLQDLFFKDVRFSTFYMLLLKKSMFYVFHS